MTHERLQKRIAACGVASRRAAERLIVAGRVRVNGEVVRDLGVKVHATVDRVEVDGKRIVAKPFVYIVLHKPREVVSTLYDPEGRATVANLLCEVGVRVYPVGRLDYTTSGVLLATNDGAFAHHLLHPRHSVPKTYAVKVRGIMSSEQLDRWKQGIELEDGKTRVAKVEFLRHEEGKTWFFLTLKEGRNQQIRRMGEATSFPVMRLARVSFAGISAEGLRPGEWRLLTSQELAMLKKTIRSRSRQASSISLVVQQGADHTWITAFFVARRKRLIDMLPPQSIVLLPAAPVYDRKMEHGYRQDPDVWYLTGLEEPHSLLVLSCVPSKTTLFVRPRTEESTRWEGERLGLEGACNRLGIDNAFPIAQLDQELPRLLEGFTRLYYQLGVDRSLDDRILAALGKARRKIRQGSVVPQEIVEPGALLHEMRLIKGPEELACIERAAQITCEAHMQVMRMAREGLHEYELEAELLAVFRKRGATRAAYPVIVGSGERATILHGRVSSRRMHAGELVLVDAGCEWEGYASDVTRTFPVGGRFSKEQEVLYELVLAAHHASLEKAYPGSTLQAIHEASVRVITEGLTRLSFLSGEVQALQEQGAYKTFFMHQTSHWLGLDVHDVGSYFPGGSSRSLVPGMVLTVEPGIYIPLECISVPEAYRGIGIRIEDDIVITETGMRNLTASLPTTVRDIELSCAPRCIRVI